MRLSDNVRPRDRELLAVIGDSIRERGMSPSERELARSMGIGQAKVHKRLARMKRMGMVASGPRASCRTLVPLLPPYIGDLELVHIPGKR